MSQPRKLENWLDGFLAYTDNTEPRVSYRKWVGISTLAAVLQRKCYIKWGRETFYPNLYIILVGPPAARKGTAMKEGKAFLNKMGINFSADETSRQKLINMLKDCQAGEQQSPGGKVHFHSSLTIFSTELTVFLGYDAKEMLSMLCKWFDCEERFVYDTHAHGREEIPNVWTNLLGATTPAQLQASLPEGAIGSGFTSRVIFIFEEDKERAIIKPELSNEQRELEEQLLIDLGEIRNLCGEFIPTVEFEALYSDWRFQSEKEGLFTEPRLDYYIQRRPTHLFKLSMIYSAARGGDMSVTRKDLENAIGTLEEAEKKMQQVFAGVGLNPLAGAQLRILRLIKQRGKIKVSELAEMMSNDLGYNQLAEVMNALTQAGKVGLDMGNKQYVYIGEKR